MHNSPKLILPKKDQQTAGTRRSHSDHPRPPHFLSLRMNARFTLIELLVVISIIALLSGMLLPVVIRGKKIAKKINCTSNIRQLGMCLDYYANDYDDNYVLGAEDLWSTNNKRWFGRRQNNSEAFDPATGYFAPYMGEKQRITECPSFAPFRDAEWNNSFEKGCGGYGYNYYFVGSRAWKEGFFTGLPKTSKRREFDCPSGTVSFADAGFVSSSSGSARVIEYSMLELPSWVFSVPYDTMPESPMRPDPVIHFRHLGKVNVLWLDGHVSDERMTFTVPKYVTHGGSTPSLYDLGWFGPDNFTLFGGK